MSKKKKDKKQVGGPYLTAALFCDYIMQDKHDDSLSVIRILDRLDITLRNPPEGWPSETSKIPVAVRALLCFRTGDAKGAHALRCIVESPSGKKGEPFEKILPFSEDQEGGANFLWNLVLHVFNGGVFWFHIYLDKKLMTRIPLRITIHRESEPQNRSDESASTPHS